MSVHASEAELLETEARSFRRSRGPLLLAVLANFAISAALLGIPYARGREHAQGSLNAFADFSACLLGGEVAKDPGLSLPRGDREHFTAQVMSGQSGWPARCHSSLMAIAPPEVTFVWPSVKRTGSDVRRAVEMLRHELERLDAEHKRLDAIPERPMLVLSKLRAALTLFAEAASVDAALDHDAIVLDNAGIQEQATRLPLMSGEVATTQAWLGDGVQALATDQRGVSWLKLADGTLERRRPRRSGLVRGTTVGDGKPYIVWATREARCADLPDRCAGRAIGIAAFDTTSDILPKPRWFRGHPHTRIDRSVSVQGGRMRLLARTLDARELELRTFELEEPQDNDSALAPVVATPLRSAGEVVDAVLLPPGHGALVVVRQDGGFIPRWFADNGASTALRSFQGGQAWSLACRAGTYTAFAYGSDSEILVSVSGQHALEHAGPIRTPLGEPYHAQDPRRDALQLHCGASGPSLVFVDRQRNLWSLRCQEGARCDAPQRLAKEAAFSDSLLLGDSLAVAYASSPFAQIRVRIGDGPALAPGPCQSPRSGMCGQPILFGDAQRLIVMAHESSDLLAMESHDGGRVFTPLRGLAQVDDGRSVQKALEQHRIRKGLN